MTRGTLILLIATFAVGAGVGALLRTPGGAQQTAKGGAEIGEDLRTVRATVSDIAEGRRIAEACSRCHGANGVSATKGVPHVAGQRPAYLYSKLRAYQAGTRGDHGMEGAVKFLSDDALVKVAAYYASLEPATPLATPGAKPASGKPDPSAAGTAAAAACNGCHGEGGVSKTPGTPSLVGLDPKYFVLAMNAYKSGQRKHDLMKSLATALSEAELRNLALYYGLQKPERAQTPAAGDQAAGKAAAGACAGCHGEQGVSSSSANPSIAGQDAEYFIAAMRAYKDGSRADESMKGIAAALDEPAIRNLAAFYASQQPQPPKVDKPLATAEWVQRCDRCHGINGNSSDVRVPAIAAQRSDYLAKSLEAYQSGARKESPMSAMSASLTPDDIAALADYYARQRARSLVYVVLPAK